MTTFDVVYAVYGALKNGDADKSQAIDVTDVLQKKLNLSSEVRCGNNSFGDPSYGYTKHFAAIVNVNGKPKYFACEENQTIDFSKSIPPTK